MTVQDIIDSDKPLKMGIEVYMLGHTKHFHVSCVYKVENFYIVGFAESLGSYKDARYVIVVEEL